MKDSFKLVAISANTNSFGLNNYVFVSPTGESWRGLRARKYCRYEEGAFITLPENRADGLSRAGFECPGRRPNAPAKVLKEIFGTESVSMAE